LHVQNVAALCAKYVLLAMGESGKLSFAEDGLGQPDAPDPILSTNLGDVPMSQRIPALSVGLAVRNGQKTLGRCVESILSQDFADLELVICDNVSDDRTVAMLEEYARSDARVRLSVNETNVGIHENMWRVLNASRGTYFRWISVDDWLEPKCLSTCVRALESRPDAVGVTTWFTIHIADGSIRYEEYRGEFPVSADPARRFERMLWFFHAGDAKYDPIYGVYRRNRLARTLGLRASERTDWLLTAELALSGPIIHVQERLAHRTRSYPVGVDRAALRRRLDPIRSEQLRTSPQRLYRDLLMLATSAGLSELELRHCRRALQRFWVKEVIRSWRESASDWNALRRRRASIVGPRGG
jgi:glycosyltransferase involved in cell wall biosynthesis